MTRSTIVSEVLLFACFVVLVKTSETTTTTIIPEIWTSTTARSPYAKDGFLAGEETPVWVAKRKGRKVVYRRIRTPIVRDSVNCWNSLKQNSSVSHRVEDSEEELDASRDARKIRLYSASLVENQSTDENEVLYPTVLVVMHYDNVDPPSNRKDWLLEEYILYGLAFWGSVDSALRVIQHPSVSLRIGGIVVVQTRQAPPYLDWNDGERSYGGSLCPMMDYWRSLANENPDFALASYDIVAHMTDVNPRSDNDECSSLWSQHDAILAVGTQGPPCRREGETAGLIVNDDFAFDGLRRAIGQMSKVLGGDGQAQSGWTWPRRNWNDKTLKYISHALKDAWCMEYPKEYHPPGRPVPQILAGELMPGEKQCEMYGYGLNADTCWNTRLEEKRSTCLYLQCAKHPQSDDTCQRTELTLDGTSCNAEKTKICLDGDCVDKPYL